ncbi:MAG: hypothetical protein LUH22_00875 [Bacteroides sp.]|nr:hypothetical protein [Bacteroides sp.]
MRKLEGIEACRNCLSRQYVNGKGLVCKQTGNKPVLEGVCTNFQLDEEFVKMAPVPEEELISVETFDEDILKKEENLPAGFFAGLAASIAGAIVWALISVSTGYQIGYMAIGMGFLVGYAVRWAGKGVSQVFGIVGAVLAVFGCFMGDFLSMIGYISREYDFSYFDALAATDIPFMITALVKNLFSMTALFYGFALFQGYKLSFRVQVKDGGKI